MKIARKFLAMLLCLTLSIVPLPFSVHAVHDDSAQSVITPRGLYCTCSTPDYYVIDRGNFLYETVIASSSVCSRRYYDNFQVKCRHCEYETWTNQTTYQETQHPTFNQVTINGETVYQCPKCKYIR